MLNREHIINSIQSQLHLISNYGVKDIGLFGSYARNEQTEESDIDILVDFLGDQENFDNYMAVYDILENLFAGKSVEIVTKNGLSPYIGPKILTEVQYVKGAN